MRKNGPIILETSLPEAEWLELPESDECRVDVSFTAVVVVHTEWTVTHRPWVFDKTVNSAQRDGQLECTQTLYHQSLHTHGSIISRTATSKQRA